MELLPAARHTLDAFEQRFALPDILVRAPGRVNLIGEHTDYNGGLALPAAINRALYIAARDADTQSVVIESLALNKTFTLRLGDEQTPDGLASKYFGGCLQVLHEAGHTIQGCEITIGGNLPMGKGLSASAALTCGLIFTFSHLFGLNISRHEIAELAQRVEHEIVGVECGLLDQYAVLLSKAEHALLIDFSDNSTQHIPVELPGYGWYVFDSGVSHELANSEYNLRRQTCEQIVETANGLGIDVDDISALADADINALLAQLDDNTRGCLMHVLSENRRVSSFQAALALGGDVSRTLGQELSDSHISLRDDYRVSCEELDFIVNALENELGVRGARMVGGGFGGHALALIETAQAEAVHTAVDKAFRKRYDRDLPMHHIALTNGVELLDFSAVSGAIG